MSSLRRSLQTSLLSSTPSLFALPFHVIRLTKSRCVLPRFPSQPPSPPQTRSRKQDQVLDHVQHSARISEHIHPLEPIHEYMIQNSVLNAQRSTLNGTAYIVQETDCITASASAFHHLPAPPAPLTLDRPRLLLLNWQRNRSCSVLYYCTILGPHPSLTAPLVPPSRPWRHTYTYFHESRLSTLESLFER